MSLKFWKGVFNFSRKKGNKSYLETHGCDSCCPRCKVWESEGNTIRTLPYDGVNDDGSYRRVCWSCEYSWRAIFTPAGFVPVEDYDKGE